MHGPSAGGVSDGNAGYWVGLRRRCRRKPCLAGADRNSLLHGAQKWGLMPSGAQGEGAGCKVCDVRRAAYTGKQETLLGDAQEEWVGGRDAGHNRTVMAGVVVAKRPSGIGQRMGRFRRVSGMTRVLG